MQLKSEIVDFIIENFLYGRDGDGLDHDASLLENGIIDSTGVLEFVSFVERTYGIFVTDDELVPDNFDSVNRLAAYIVRKRDSDVGNAQTHSSQ